jgi:hypothetical protein
MFSCVRIGTGGKRTDTGVEMKNGENLKVGGEGSGYGFTEKQYASVPAKGWKQVEVNK